MEHDATLELRIVFLDRDGKRSTITLRLPFSVPATTAISRGIVYASTLLAISNAVVPSLDVTYHYDDPAPGLAEMGSDVKSKVAFLYRDGDRYESIIVPSPRPSIFENEGAYTGVRVDSTLDEMAPWIEAASTLLANLKTKEGLDFPNVYLVGGLEL